MPKKSKNSDKIKIGSIVTLILSIITALLLYGNYQINLQTNQASIDYSFEKEEIFHRITNNNIEIKSFNGGKMDGSFYLIINMVNATFSNGTQMPYTKIDDTSAKFRWTLHESNHGNKVVYFNIDDGVQGFSLRLTLEKANNSPLKDNDIYPCFLQYVWTGRYFELIEEPN